MDERARITEAIAARLRGEARRTNIFWPILVFSLFASVTNYAPFSIVASFIGFALWPFGLTLGWRVPKPILALACMFGFFLLYVVFYNPELLTDLSFYRRDGNVFVTMAPLLFFGCLAMPFDIDRILKQFVYFATALNFIVFVFWYVFDIALFRQWGTATDSGLGLYHFLFVAHNAGGGFIGMLSCFTLALYMYQRNSFHLCLLAINVVTLAATFSRGSIGGFFGAVLFLQILGVAKRWPMWVLAFMLAVNLCLVGFIYSNTDIEIVIVRQQLVTRLLGNLHPAFLPLVDGNLAIRVEVLWPMAMHAFFQSPLLGIGFSGFNDVPWDLWGWPGVVAFNASKHWVNSDANAHNTYLQILAETGVVGLSLLIWFIKRLDHYLKNLQSGMVGEALLMALWMAIISAFSEHRFFTPSEMLPFILLLSMAMANKNYNDMLEQHLADMRFQGAKAALRQAPAGGVP